MQFDATKIVTSGVDHNLQVIDITTGEVLQTLRGHEAPVVALAFDSMQIVSTSSDGILRHWEWGSASKRADKLHIYDNGDNLAKISRKYKVPIPDIIKWNGIKDIKKLYVGQKLIVQKGDPDEPTEAELQASTLKAADRAREAKVDGKIQAAIKKAEEEMAKANGQTQSNKLKIDSHIERATLTSRLLKGTGDLLRKDYVEIDEKAEKEALKAKDYTSLLARIKHGGKTKDQMAKKIDAKKQWESNVKEEGYKPDEKKIQESLSMFLLYQVVDDLVKKDVIKDAMATDLFNESLNGRFFNFSKGKKPVYKAARRFGNALDYAKGEGDDDESTVGGSIGGLEPIKRLSEIEYTKTIEEKAADEVESGEAKRRSVVLERALTNRKLRNSDEVEGGDDAESVQSKKSVGFNEASLEENVIGGETLGSHESGSPDSHVKKKKKKKKKDNEGGIDRTMTAVMRDEDYDHNDPLVSSMQHRASLARKVMKPDHQMHFAD